MITERDDYTCGMCGMICKIVEGHPCLKGYKHMYIDKNNYFYPMLVSTDDGQSFIRRSRIDDRSEVIILEKQENINPNVSTPKPSKNIRKTSSGHELFQQDIEILILEVQKRAPLWDYYTPLEQRSYKIVKQLWDEVALQLNGKITGPEAKKKFKNVRDTYRRIIQAEQCGSGSGRNDSKEKWKYYEIMEFLRDFCVIRKTETNVSEEFSPTESTDFVDVDASNETDGNSEEVYSVASDSGSGLGPRRWKRSRKDSTSNSEDSASVITKIADALCRKAPPVQPQPDEVESILHAAGLQLRQMPYARRMETLIDIMQMVNSRLTECKDK